MMGSGGLGAVIAEAADNIFDGLSASVCGTRPMQEQDLPQPDGRSGWRMWTLGDAGQLTSPCGVHRQFGGAPVGWRAGPLYGTCALRDHPAPGPRCECGTCWADSPAVCVRFWQHAVDFHAVVERRYGKQIADAVVHVQPTGLVFGQVAPIGKTLPSANPADGPGWWRSLGAQVTGPLFVPREMATVSEAISGRYGVEVVVEAVDAAGFLGHLADRYRADQVQRPCPICVLAGWESPGGEYPICRRCLVGFDGWFERYGRGLVSDDLRPARTVTAEKGRV